MADQTCQATLAPSAWPADHPVLCTTQHPHNSQAALGSRSYRPRADFPRAQNSGWRICVVPSGAPSLTTAVRSGADGVAFVPLIIPARPRPAAYSTRPPASVPGPQPRRWRRTRPRVFIIMSSTARALLSLGSAMEDLPALPSPRSPPPAPGRTCPAGRASPEPCSRGRPRTLSRRGKGSGLRPPRTRSACTSTFREICFACATLLHHSSSRQQRTGCHKTQAAPVEQHSPRVLGLTRRDRVRQHPPPDGCDPDSRFPSPPPSSGYGAQEVECRLNFVANPQPMLPPRAPACIRSTLRRTPKGNSSRQTVGTCA